MSEEYRNAFFESPEEEARNAEFVRLHGACEKAVEILKRYPFIADPSNESPKFYLRAACLDLQVLGIDIVEGFNQESETKEYSSVSSLLQREMRPDDFLTSIRWIENICRTVRKNVIVFQSEIRARFPRPDRNYFETLFHAARRWEPRLTKIALILRNEEIDREHVVDFTRNILELVSLLHYIIFCPDEELESMVFKIEDCEFVLNQVHAPKLVFIGTREEKSYIKLIFKFSLWLEEIVGELGCLVRNYSHVFYPGFWDTTTKSPDYIHVSPEQAMEIERIAIEHILPNWREIQLHCERDFSDPKWEKLNHLLEQEIAKAQTLIPEDELELLQRVPVPIYCGFKTNGDSSDTSESLIVSPAKTDQAKETSSDWKASPPTEGAHYQYGPLTGQLKQLTKWIGQDRRNLKNKNGKGRWWIMRDHTRKYQMWFSSQAEYTQANAKRLSENARNDTK